MKKIRNRWNVLTALVLSVAMLLSVPVQAKVPEPGASVTAANMLSLANKYDKSALFLLKRFKNKGNSLLEWAGSGRSLIGILETTTHETCHDFMNSSYGTYHYYAGNGKSYPVPRTTVFPTKSIASTYRKSLRTDRYSIYIANANSILTANQFGPYGLLDEFAAYYWGMHLVNSLIPYFEKYASDFKLADEYMTLCENDRLAYAEFRYFILHYLYYAKKHKPAVYSGVISNAAFRKAYRILENKFSTHIKKYGKELKRLAKIWKKKGYTTVITDNAVTVTEPQQFFWTTIDYPVLTVGRFTSEYKALTKECKKSKYAKIEKLLKR